MITAAILNQSATSFSKVISYSLNLKDAMTVTPIIGSVVVGDNTYFFLTFPYLLYKIKSQQTGNQKIFTNESLAPALGVNFNTIDRYVQTAFLYYSVNPASTEDLSSAELKLGNADFPLGFYDLTIYQTETVGELNPDNATATLYNGLLSLKGSDTQPVESLNFPAVKYKEYTTNDTDTEAVYITNTPN